MSTLQKRHTHNIWLFSGIISLLFLVLYIYTFEPKLVLLGDNAQYYTLGKALAHGEGYINLSSVARSPNNHYPPGYPVMISLVMQISESLFAVKLFNGLCFIASLLLLYFIFKKITDNVQVAFVVCIFLVLNSHLLWYSSIIMSEVPYLLMSVLALFFFTRTDFEGQFYKDGNFYASLVFLAASYYTRSVGIALLAGFLLYLLTKKKWIPMGAYLGGFVLLALPWYLRSASLGGSTYLNKLKLINPYQPDLGEAGFGDFADRFFNNLIRYITTEIPNACFPFIKADYQSEATASQWLLGLFLLAFIIFGLFQLKRFRWLILGYLIGTFGILMIWPDVWFGVRFMLPVTPFLVFLIVVAVEQVLARISTAGKFRKPGLLILLVLGLAFVSPIQAIHKEGKTEYSPQWKNYFKLAQWLKNNGTDKVVVSCGKPALFHVYSDTYTVRYKFTSNQEELLKDLERRKVDYVVIDQVYGNTLRYLLPVVRTHPEKFEMVRHLKNPDTFLLKFVP